MTVQARPRRLILGAVGSPVFLLGSGQEHRRAAWSFRKEILGGHSLPGMRWTQGKDRWKEKLFFELLDAAVSEAHLLDFSAVGNNKHSFP